MLFTLNILFEVKITYSFSNTLLCGNKIIVYNQKLKIGYEINFVKNPCFFLNSDYIAYNETSNS